MGKESHLCISNNGMCRNMPFVFNSRCLSDLPYQYEINQGNEAQALEEVEALHQLTGSPSDLDCSLT